MKYKIKEAVKNAVARLIEKGMDGERLKAQAMIAYEAAAAWADGREAFILEAPTGAGKSVIGMLVADVLKEVSGMDAYLLTSTKSLQEQLESDSARYSLNWAMLKGQSNYECHINGAPFTDRDCMGDSLAKAYELPCAGGCGYLCARKDAMESGCAVLSYSYWLTAMNFAYDEDNPSEKNFAPRGLTIMDECHLLADIVQDAFAPKLPKYDTLLKTQALMCGCMGSFSFPIEEYEKCYRLAESEESDYGGRALDSCINILAGFGKAASEAIKKLNEAYPAESKAAKKKRASALAAASGMASAAETAREIAFLAGTVRMASDGHIVLKRIDEAELVKRHAIKFTDFTLYMSATIGDIPLFAANCGITNYACSKMASGFTYKDCGIYKVLPMLNMGASKRDANMPRLLDNMGRVAEELHADVRGLIHTVSNALTDAIKARYGNNPRYIFYRGAEEKAEALKKLARTKNGIIVGPSLMEGISLNDGLCRFILFPKCPYPPIDAFAQKKMEFVKGWYEWKTMQAFYQGAGRGIRHKDDHAKIYIFDECFNFTFSKSAIPPYIKGRLANININNLTGNNAIEDPFAGL